MEYIKKTRLIENYRLRDVSKSLLESDGHHALTANTSSYVFYKHNFSTTYNNGVYTNSVNTIVQDTTSDGVLYGKVLDYKTDREGNPIRNSAGKIIPNTIDINIFLKQSFDDMGMFTDMDFVPFQNGAPLSTDQFLDQVYRQLSPDPNDSEFIKPNPFNPFIDGRHPLTTEVEYEQNGITVNGETDDRKLGAVQRYVFVNGKPDYKVGLNRAQDIHTTFDGVINRTQGANSYVEYVIGGSVNPSGNHTTDYNDQLQVGTGVVFKTYDNITKIGDTEYDVKKEAVKIKTKYKKTEFKHDSGGRRIAPTPFLDSNMVLQAIFKEEEFSGIVFPPEVEDNVFIIRGVEDIFERHAAMAEIKTRNDIDEYRDNYY